MHPLVEPESRVPTPEYVISLSKPFLFFLSYGKILFQLAEDEW